MDHLRRGLHPAPARSLCPALPGPRARARRPGSADARHPPRPSPRGGGRRPRRLASVPTRAVERRHRLPQLGQLALLARQVPVPIGQLVLLVEQEPDQVVAGGMVQIKHDPSYAVRAPQETHPLNSEQLPAGRSS